MIGVAKIPLASLASGCSMHDHFPIKTLSEGSEVGKLEVRIDVMSMEGAHGDGLFSASKELVFSKQFEQEILMQIARKLPLHCDVKLIFGMFSQGQRSCDRAAFKHTCLNRLRLQRDGMTERELEIFLESND